MTLGGWLETGVKDLGIRFLLVQVLPNILLLCAAILAFRSFDCGRGCDLTDLARQMLGELSLDNSARLGLASLLLSLVLSPLQLWLVRLMEGYWKPGLFRRKLLVIQEERRQALIGKTRIEVEEGSEPSPEQLSLQAQATARLIDQYPRGERLMPTSLGNAMRAAEDLASSRYGLDTVVIWPRLYPLLPESMKTAVDAQRNQLDTSVRLTATLAAIGLLLLSATLTSGSIVGAFAGLLSLLLSGASYQASVHAAIHYGKSINAAIDLHRFDLLKALHLPLPATLARERQVNELLSGFLREGGNRELWYEHESRPAAK